MTNEITPERIAELRLENYPSIQAILAEREKQAAKWGDGHDDRHTASELIVAAADLLMHVVHADLGAECSALPKPDDFWGLAEKHKEPAKRLAIAAALVAAEMDRRDRCKRIAQIVDHDRR